VDERDRLAQPFEENRAHLRAVAYRMLGSPSEADDAVQEAWLRLHRAETSEVANLRAWLTTVVARVCLDMLRARKARPEEPLDLDARAEKDEQGDERAIDPEQAGLLADSVGLALLVVLETLDPAERVAFVLHDLFALPFDEIAPVVGRSPAAARQLASRARRRMQGARAVAAEDRNDAREVVAAFLAASREGNFAALLAVLDPEVVLRADPMAVQIAAARRTRGAPPLAREVRGAASVAKTFSGHAQAAQMARIDGAVGAVWAPGGRPRAAFVFNVANGKIVTLDLIVDPARLGDLDIVLGADG
jgi:RNA polymerase sigma factor (sigma-70 family)